jgi:hypothetical protein
MLNAIASAKSFNSECGVKRVVSWAKGSQLIEALLSKFFKACSNGFESSEMTLFGDMGAGGKSISTLVDNDDDFSRDGGVAEIDEEFCVVICCSSNTGGNAVALCLGVGKLCLVVVWSSWYFME